MYANPNPSQLYAQGKTLSGSDFMPTTFTPGTLKVDSVKPWGDTKNPFPKGKISIPGTVDQYDRAVPYVEYAPGNENRNIYLQQDGQKQQNATTEQEGMSPWLWVAIAAAGGLVLYYVIK